MDHVRFTASLPYGSWQDREVEQELKKLRDVVSAAGGTQARILPTHFASLGAADAALEQEAADVATLEG